MHWTLFNYSWNLQIHKNERFAKSQVFAKKNGGLLNQGKKKQTQKISK